MKLSGFKFPSYQFTHVQSAFLRQWSEVSTKNHATLSLASPSISLLHVAGMSKNDSQVETLLHMIWEECAMTLMAEKSVASHQHGAKKCNKNMSLVVMNWKTGIVHIFQSKLIKAICRFFLLWAENFPCGQVVVRNCNHLKLLCWPRREHKTIAVAVFIWQQLTLHRATRFLA